MTKNELIRQYKTAIARGENGKSDLKRIAFRLENYGYYINNGGEI